MSKCKQYNIAFVIRIRKVVEEQQQTIKLCFIVGGGVIIDQSLDRTFFALHVFIQDVDFSRTKKS